MSEDRSKSIEWRAAHLVSLVGKEFVRIHGETVLVFPSDTTQISQILRFAHDCGLVVVPSGGATKLGWGNPVESDIQVSLSRICQVRAHSWQDMTCTAEAGIRWATMQQSLGRHGQKVALDPLWPEVATVGGIVATNDSGAMRLRYGGLRDQIIGMKMVLADGAIAKSGGMVVKNVAGYDLHKLMTGSFGTLGIITEVNFRLYAVEEHARTWSVVSSELDAERVLKCTNLLLALLNSQLMLSRVQLRAGKEHSTIDIRMATVPECMEDGLVRLRAILGGLEFSESEESVWLARLRLFDDADSIILKISVLPSEICSVCFYLQERAAESNTRVSIVAQVNGIVTVALNGDTESAIALIDDVRAKIAPAGDSVVVIRPTSQSRGCVDPWGPNPSGWSLMREIKHRFDPGRILSPGRFIGGI